jgi:hypothetical protein
MSAVNIISLNQIINLFSSFAEQHFFIKDFGYGPTSDIGVSRQMNFPYLWLSLDQNSTISVVNKTAIPSYGITILLLDKINIQKNYLDINGVNSDNSQEILSDTLQCLQDLITEIEVNWGSYGLKIDGDVSCFPAVDETPDKVCGWVGQFPLKVKHSNCITPMGNIVQTNLSPINPFSQYLTCDTLPNCPTIINIESQLTGLTSGLTCNNLSGCTIIQDLQDAVITGGTFTSGTLTLNNATSPIVITGFTSGGAVSGYSYNNQNQFTINTNSGNYNATINTMTGLTINGNLDVDTIDEVDTIDFNLTPTGTNGIGRLRWNNTDGTLDLGLKGGNVTLQVGQEIVVRVVNKTGTLIPNGSVVRVVQVTGGVTGIALSLGDNDLNSSGTIGITTEDIADNAQGFVTIQGLVHQLNTNAFTEGDVLYLSPTIPGGITNVKPIAPQHMVIVGYCVKKNLTDGHILLHVQNGYELEELHNVQITGTTKGGSLLEYNTSTSVWVDSPIVWTTDFMNALSVDVYAPYDLSIDTITNIKNAPTLTIYDDGVLYVLGATIAVGSKINIQASVNGVCNLTLSKI